MLRLLAAHRVPRNQLYGVALLYLPLTAEAARIAAAEQAAAEAIAAEEAAAAVALAAEAELAKASLDRPELKAAAKAELYDSGDEDTGGDNAEEAVRFTQLDCAYIILRTCRSYSIFFIYFASTANAIELVFALHLLDWQVWPVDIQSVIQKPCMTDTYLHILCRITDYMYVNAPVRILASTLVFICMYTRFAYCVSYGLRCTCGAYHRVISFLMGSGSSTTSLHRPSGRTL